MYQVRYGVMIISLICFIGISGKVDNRMNSKNKQVVKKYLLDNGMTILVRPIHQVPKVSVQLWYNVGSKDEKTGEKGIAHLIEHMIFKGTDTLSESDINTVTHMLSGSCNAFTSYDYTGYLFNMPKQNWVETLPIMADCMQNCKFDGDMLNSEMKAVIQELKMYRDNYSSSLFESMISTVFDDHPYHNPIIGYKQDLWGASSEVLHAFYKKHYVPNNAALVIVGDVEPDEVFKLAKQWFNDIPANPDYVKATHYLNHDIASKSVTLYRDVQQSLVTYGFLVPGLQDKKDHILNLLAWVLGKGKSSRLYKKLVDELELATSVSADSDDLFEHGLFFIVCEPKNIEDIPAIEKIITEEINAIVQDGLDEQEVVRAIKQTEMTLYNLLEDFEHQAYQIGKYFWSTGDENYIFNYLQDPAQDLQQEMQQMVAAYLRPAVMHRGTLLPLPDTEKQTWMQLQEASDAEDNKILEAHPRHTPVEPPSYAQTVKVHELGAFNFPKAQTITLSNGLKVLYHHNPNTPKIDVALQFKAKSFYDPQEKQGLYTFMADMLTEGTKEHSSQELADLIESRGMMLSAYPGGIGMRMINEDFSFGMSILEEILTKPLFDAKHIEKVRAQILADIKNYWDEPWSFSAQLVREQLYKNHPYSKNALGLQDTIVRISQQDLVDFYHQVISPYGATIAIVGNLNELDIKQELEKALGKWQGKEVAQVEFPQLVRISATEVDYPINRDQVVLCFAGISVNRKDPDYDKLLLFDQIFGGGVLGSMSSRLFELREQSGLFYRINGSLVAGADEQPGAVLVKTIVSLDRLPEAEKVIKQTIDTVADTITEQDLQEAKHALLNATIDRFASNRGMAAMFLFLDRFGFPSNYLDNRALDLDKVTVEDLKTAVKKVLGTDKLLTLRVGRVGSMQK